MQRIRVLNINRNRILREGIRALINTHPDLLLVGSSEGADDIPLLFMQTRPNVILMDLNMPLEAGLNALARIIEIDPGASVIGLVTYDDDDDLVEKAMRAGASAVLAKDLIREELVPLVRARTRQGQSQGPAA